MSAGVTIADSEVVTLPIGNGRYVRIADGQSLHIVGGVDDTRDGGEQAGRSASTWLARLKRIAGSA